VLVSAENFNLHAEKEHRHLRVVDLREAHGVFLRGDKGVEGTAVAPFEEAENFLFGEAVVVGE
jgi:hypothetical protein